LFCEAQSLVVERLRGIVIFVEHEVLVWMIIWMRGRRG